MFAKIKYICNLSLFAALEHIYGRYRSIQSVTHDKVTLRPNLHLASCVRKPMSVPLQSSLQPISRQQFRVKHWRQSADIVAAIIRLSQDAEEIGRIWSVADGSRGAR